MSQHSPWEKSAVNPYVLEPRVLEYWVDPYAVASIRDGLIKVAQDEEYRKTLIEKGRENRLRFSWDKTAQKVWACMEKSL